MTLEELLNDTEKVKDDLEIEIPGMGKLKVGDFRSRLTAVKAAEQKAAEARKAAEDARTALTELATKGAKLVEDLEKEKNAAPQKKVEGEIDFENDAIYGPLVTKKLKPIETQLATFADTLKKMSEDYAASAKFVLQDYYERQWDRIPADKRPKDKTWKDYLKVAAEKGILNDAKLPDPVRAFLSEIEPVERQTLAQENEKLKKQNEDLQNQLKAPRMPRPGAAGAPPIVTGKDGKVFESVDALVDAAFADPLIQSIAGGGRPE